MKSKVSRAEWISAAEEWKAHMSKVEAAQAIYTAALKNAEKSANTIVALMTKCGLTIRPFEVEAVANMVLEIKEPVTDTASTKSV